MSYVKFNTEKKKIVTDRKNGDKNRKALHNLMNNAVYVKTMENLRYRINVRLVSNRKDYKVNIKIKLHVTKNI